MALSSFEPNPVPTGGLLSLQDALERFQRNPAFSLGVSGYGAYPPVNVFDDGDGLVVIAELPGFEPSDVNVTGQNRTLTITSRRKGESGTGVVGFHRRERALGEFSRSIQLPDEFDLSRAAARYEAGVLKIQVPRRESAKPRQIGIQTA